jgi:Ca2+-binding RTX toxin-like protein
MVGGAGNDTFYVDDASDAIGELGGEGNDRIAASVSFALSNGADVETIEAVNVAATTAFDLTGSNSNNTITGNNGVNILKGEGGSDILNGAGGDDFLVGGTGNDTMNGGTGNDTYYVDATGDVVNEFAGEGTNDRVATSVSYTLSAGSDVERLEAVTSGTTNAMDLTGSSIANTITGNDGTNVLDGKGGSDVLTGLGGADTFQFTTALGASNVDTIADFVHGTDKIALDDAIFAAIGSPGALNANAFVTGTAAGDADDRIIYNSTTGQLFYDADGNGGGGAVLFAQMYGAPTLSASDFQVI